MRVTPTALAGVFLIRPKVFTDERGFFLETYNAGAMAEFGLDRNYVQDNHARSAKGVLRGLHFQTPPMAQTKLIRVVGGSVFDVVVDLRVGSATYGRWESFVLSAENHMQLFVPKGFAHGYLALEDDTEFLYKVDAFYSPDHDAGILWNDPDLSIDWPDTSPLPAPLISPKDATLPRFRDFSSPFADTDGGNGGD